MPLLALIPFLAVGFLGLVVDAEFERLITAALQLGTILLVTAHARHVRKAVEPKVNQIAAVTTRKLGERLPTGEYEPWDGVERRGNHVP